MIITDTVLLGKYRVVSRLGEGGMGAVYRARDEMLDRDVAIKVLRPELASQDSLVERFRGEAVALARLAHPRIATLHGFERDGDQFYMVMEFLRGDTLEDVVRRDGPRPWQQAVNICAAVCDALSHAHQQGVVHRDIKPANIMLGDDGSVKVMDFGIARMVGSSRQTRHGSTVGTPNYMSPEQLRGEESDGRTDLYAVGAVLYELISGAMSFEADSDYALMMKQLNNTPPMPSEAVADVPSHVDQIVARAMAKRPQDRFADAAAMKKALERAIEGAIPFTAPHPIARAAQAPGRWMSQAREWLDDDEPQDVLAPPLSRDWRIWGSGAAVMVAAIIWFGGGSAAGVEELDVNPNEVELATGDEVIDVAAGGGGASGDRGGYLGAGSSTDNRDGGLPPLTGGERLVPISPSPSPTPSPSPRKPVERGPDQRESVTPPSPPPAPEPSAAELERAASSAVRTWFNSFGSGSPGIVDPELRKLLDEKRVLLGSSQAARASVSGSTASASASATLKVRSAFGGSRDVSVRFNFDLRQEGSSWRVTRAKLADASGL